MKFQKTSESCTIKATQVGVVCNHSPSDGKCMYAQMKGVVEQVGRQGNVYVQPFKPERMEQRN